MFSHKELLDMLATEAVESIFEESREKPRQEESPLTVNYDLRLVYDSEGRLEWKDD